MVHYIIRAMTIELFFVQPYIVQAMFTSFDCINVDGKLLLASDIVNPCYHGTHLLAIGTITVPSLFLWVLGIPLLAYNALRSYQTALATELHTHSFKQTS